VATLCVCCLHRRPLVCNQSCATRH
jgi:hypothetical protein